MKKYLLEILIFSAVLVSVLGASIFWWRVWMYQGVIGPIPVLHWFIPADGEFSYDLTLYEMLLQLTVIFITTYKVLKFKLVK